MGLMIQIEESSAMEMKDHAKKALKHMGKLMECVEELCEESQMGERGGSRCYGNRYDSVGRYGNRMGYREEDFEDDDEDFGERRGRSSRTGRFIRR